MCPVRSVTYVGGQYQYHQDSRFHGNDEVFSTNRTALHFHENDESSLEIRYKKNAAHKDTALEPVTG